MTDDFRLSALREEHKRRYGGLTIVPELRKGLHEKQLALTDDPSKKKTGLWGRRSGKSTWAASDAVISGLAAPGLTIPFIAPSRGSAKRILWSPLHQLNFRHRLGIEFNATELTATLPNEAVIWLCGANDEDDIEKLRGTAGGYPKAYIDECASIGPHLRPLVEEVLDAALADYDGQMILLGSAGVQCKGVFFDATTGRTKEKWSNHRATILDNPFFPRWAGKKNWKELAAKFLDDKRATKGWDEGHPIYRREWLADWVASDTGLVYRFSEAKNTYTGDLSAEFDWEYILGVDLGFDDPTAFTVLAFSEDSPNLYEVYGYNKPGMIPSEIAEHIAALDGKYHFVKMVADTGGLGKSIVEEFRVRHGIPIEPAEKKNKAEYIELFNGDLYTGKIKVRAESPVIAQWQNIRWDEDSDVLDETDDDLVVERARGGLGKRRKEDDRDANDQADSFLYCWKEARHWMHVPPVPKPVRGSKEFTDALEQRMMKRVFDEVERKKRSTNDELLEDFGLVD